jgi:hypothetical protein
MVESLRVLSTCRKTAVAARRVALQLIQNTIVCAPDGLRDDLRSMTRMQLIRTRNCQEFRAGLGMMGAKEPDHAESQRASYS